MPKACQSIAIHPQDTWNMAVAIIRSGRKVSQYNVVGPCKIVRFWCIYIYVFILNQFAPLQNIFNLSKNNVNNLVHLKNEKLSPIASSEIDADVNKQKTKINMPLKLA